MNAAADVSIFLILIKKEKGSRKVEEAKNAFAFFPKALVAPCHDRRKWARKQKREI